MPKAPKSCYTCEGCGRVQLLPARGIRLGGRRIFMDCPDCKPDFSSTLQTEYALRHVKLQGRLSALLAVILIESLLFAAYVAYTT